MNIKDFVSRSVKIRKNYKSISGNIKKEIKVKEHELMKAEEKLTQAKNALKIARRAEYDELKEIANAVLQEEVFDKVEAPVYFDSDRFDKLICRINNCHGGDIQQRIEDARALHELQLTVKKFPLVYRIADLFKTLGIEYEIGTVPKDTVDMSFYGASQFADYPCYANISIGKGPAKKIIYSLGYNVSTGPTIYYPNVRETHPADIDILRLNVCPEIIVDYPDVMGERVESDIGKITTAQTPHDVLLHAIDKYPEYFNFEILMKYTDGVSNHPDVQSKRDAIIESINNMLKSACMSDVFLRLKFEPSNCSVCWACVGEHGTVHGFANASKWMLSDLIVNMRKECDTIPKTDVIILECSDYKMRDMVEMLDSSGNNYRSEQMRKYCSISGAAYVHGSVYLSIIPKISNQEFDAKFTRNIISSFKMDFTGTQQLEYLMLEEKEPAVEKSGER